MKPSINNALFIQILDVDAVQPIYAQETADRGLLEKIAETSLRLFLTETPLSKSGKWYKLKKNVETPDNGTVTIRTRISRDAALKLCMLDAELNPVGWRGLLRSHVLHINIFGKTGQMLSFETIQSALNEFRRPSLAECSSSQNSQKDCSDTEIPTPSIPQHSLASSRRRDSMLSSSSLLDPEVTTEPTSSTIETERTQPNPEIVSSEPVLCSALYVQIQDIYKEQPIYIRKTPSEGDLIEIAHSSLNSFLKDTPLTSCGRAYECTKRINDRVVHFLLHRNHTLLLGVLDRKHQPIRNKFKIYSLGIFSEFGVITSVDQIQRNLEDWPKQRSTRRSASDPGLYKLSIPTRSKPLLKAQASPSSSNIFATSLSPTSASSTDASSSD